MLALKCRGAFVLLLIAGLVPQLPAFGATAAPTISGYAATNPRGVPISSAPPGAPVLIEGQDLGTSGTVAFGGIPAPPAASWSPTEILVTVPTASSYPFVGPVTVTTSGQAASGPAFTITQPTPWCVGAWCVITPPFDASGPPGQICGPSALAVDALGNLYIGDYPDCPDYLWLQERDTQGRWSVIERPPSAPVVAAAALAVDRVGNLYVLFPTSDSQDLVPILPEEIYKRDTQGKWSLLGAFDAGITTRAPGGLAVDAAGSLYVTDWSNDRIEKWDGKWSVIATGGSALGQVLSPAALAVDTAGNLYVADYGDDKVQKRDAQGNWSLIATFGSALGQVGHFPNALAADAAGNLYVADRGNDRIQKRDAQGNWFLITTAGTALGQVSGVSGLAVDGAGNLYVADSGNNRVLECIPGSP